MYSKKLKKNFKPFFVKSPSLPFLCSILINISSAASVEICNNFLTNSIFWSKRGWNNAALNSSTWNRGHWSAETWVLVFPDAKCFEINRLKIIKKKFQNLIMQCNFLSDKTLYSVLEIKNIVQNVVRVGLLCNYLKLFSPMWIDNNIKKVNTTAQNMLLLQF